MQLSLLPFLLLYKSPKGSTVFKLLLFSYPFTFRDFFFSLNFIPLPFFYILVHFSSHFSHCLHSCRQDQVLLMIQQQKTFLLFRNLKRADDCTKSSFLLVCCIIVIFIHLCHKQNTCRLIKSAC